MKLSSRSETLTNLRSLCSHTLASSSTPLPAGSTSHRSPQTSPSSQESASPGQSWRLKSVDQTPRNPSKDKCTIISYAQVVGY